MSSLPQFNKIEHGDSFKFNCSTNDKTAITSLWIKVNSDPWKQRQLKPGKLEKKENVFTLLSADGHDAYPYKCKAVNQEGKEIWTKGLIYLFLTKKGNVSFTISTLKNSSFVMICPWLTYIVVLQKYFFLHLRRTCA